MSTSKKTSIADRHYYGVACGSPYLLPAAPVDDTPTKQLTKEQIVARAPQDWVVLDYKGRDILQPTHVRSMERQAEKAFMKETGITSGRQLVKARKSGAYKAWLAGKAARAKVAMDARAAADAAELVAEGIAAQEEQAALLAAEAKVESAPVVAEDAA